MYNWILYELTEHDKQQRVDLLLVTTLSSYYVVTYDVCDEKYDNANGRGHRLDVGEPRQHFPKPKMTPQKILLLMWWTALGVVH